MSRRLLSLCACLAAMLLACGAGKKKVYERADLEKKVRGMSEEELRRTLGAPDDYGPGTAGNYWTYKRITKHPKTQEVEDDVTIITQGGRATIFVYSGDPPLKIHEPKNEPPITPFR